MSTEAPLQSGSQNRCRRRRRRLKLEERKRTAISNISGQFGILVVLLEGLFRWWPAHNEGAPTKSRLFNFKWPTGSSDGANQWLSDSECNSDYPLLIPIQILILTHSNSKAYSESKADLDSNFHLDSGRLSLNLQSSAEQTHKRPTICRPQSD